MAAVQHEDILSACQMPVRQNLFSDLTSKHLVYQ